MELSSPPSSSQLIITSNESETTSSTGDSFLDPTVGIRPTKPCSNPNQISKSINNGGGRVVKKNKRLSKPFPAASSSQQRGLRVMGKLKHAKVIVNGGRRHFYGETDFDSLALPLGMSIAAFVTQVLDRSNVADERISTDHLSLICTSAVKESLANVFGDRFDRFVKNFGESFGCTLKTLRLVNETSLNSREPLGHSSIESINSEASLSTGEPFGHSSIESINSEASQTTYLDVHGNHQNSSVLKSSDHHSPSLDGHRDDPSRFALKSSVAMPSISGMCNSFDRVEEIQENLRLDAMNRELTLHGQINQRIACVTPRKLGSVTNGCMLNTFERSVIEQARSNDLKMYEIGLKMKELQLKESQLTLSSDSNRLDRFKLSMGISKASFKTEKFKTQLEETRHEELLKKCVDCLVAGLFIMSASLVYGAYVYSYDRISEVTTSCSSPPKESKSWWMPKGVASVNSGLHEIKCQVMVWSRMLFGLFMILSIAYLLLQRSSTSKQTMPVTNILLLLGIMCGLAGKFCVDTLGGSGYNWLLHWEALCLLHFFANICTSTLFMILHGSVCVSQGIETKARFPYWVRRLLFYTLTLVLLPLLCGLMPFAGPSDWKDHIISLVLVHMEGS